MDTKKVQELLAKLRAHKSPDGQLMRELADITEQLLIENEKMSAAIQRHIIPIGETPTAAAN